MGVTRDYYEKLLIQFDKLCKVIKNSELLIIKNDITQALNDIDKYYLFPITLSDNFYSLIKSDTANINDEQSILTYELYVYLGELMFSFEDVSIPAYKANIDYPRILETSRTELSFNVVSNWGTNILKTKNKGYSSDVAFFIFNRQGLDIKTNEEYSKYKQSLRENYINNIGEAQDIPIPSKTYDTIQDHFTKLIISYRKYLEDNYPEIKHLFPSYNANIRIYISNNRKDKLLHVYMYNKLDDSSIYIYPYYQDFLYRFHNAEEIEYKPINAFIGLFDISSKSSYFSIFTIHHELHKIFINKGNNIDLKEYLIYILRGQMYRISNNIIDDEITINNLKCKLFFNVIPNIDQLKDLILDGADLKYKYICFKVYPDNETIKFIENLSINYFVIDKLGRDIINNQNGEMIHWFIKNRLNNINHDKQDISFSQGNLLIEKLKNCPLGHEGWVAYENIGTDIFDYLFKDDFRQFSYKKQSFSYEHIFRKDLIVNNNYKDSASFWAKAKFDFNCNLIVIDFKNYSAPLNQNEFYLPSKYLNPISGKFGIVFSRKGLDNSAKILQKKQFSQNNELIICLDDDDLTQMIKEKMSGQNPIYRLENILFQLYE